uniref:Uncharacterized protein n=1 Tax=Arundo donax TaxID=35708 RepID=A0A0A9A6C7_ARUDO
MAPKTQKQRPKKDSKTGGQESKASGSRIRCSPRPPAASQCGDKVARVGAKGGEKQPSLDSRYLVGFGGWIWVSGFGIQIL